MNRKKISDFNYFNEALLLATYMFNNEFEEESKPKFDSKFEEFIYAIRNKSKDIIENSESMKNIFLYSEDIDSPNILYFLTFTKLRRSITDYKKKEFLDLYRELLISNMKSLGYQINETVDLDFVENLDIFDDFQKYLLLKFTINHNGLFDDFYQFVEKIENIISDNFHIVEEEYKSFLDNLDFTYIEQLNVFKLVKENLSTLDIDKMEYIAFIQFSEVVGISVEEKSDKFIAYIFIGILPYIFEKTSEELEDDKKEILNRLSIISDETRLSILMMLGETEMYNKQIADELSLSTGTISHHISNLMESGLINARVKGKRIYYSKNTEKLKKISDFIELLASNRKGE